MKISLGTLRPIQISQQFHKCVTWPPWVKRWNESTQNSWNLNFKHVICPYEKQNKKSLASLSNYIRQANFRVGLSFLEVSRHTGGSPRHQTLQWEPLAWYSLQQVKKTPNESVLKQKQQSNYIVYLVVYPVCLTYNMLCRSTPDWHTSKNDPAHWCAINEMW